MDCDNSPTCSWTIVANGKASIWSLDAGGGPAPSSWFSNCSEHISNYDGVQLLFYGNYTHTHTYDDSHAPV